MPVTARAQKEDRKRLTIVMNLPEHDLEAQHGSQALVLKLRELGYWKVATLISIFDGPPTVSLTCPRL
jgi:hypothetical protein